MKCPWTGSIPHSDRPYPRLGVKYEFLDIIKALLLLIDPSKDKH